MSDAINPNHYTRGAVECIDAIEAATVAKRGIEAACTANVIKYLWRYEAKNGLEDVKKARWYIERLIGQLEKQRFGQLNTLEFDEARMDVIGQNGNEGEHYATAARCSDCSAEHCPCVAR